VKAVCYHRYGPPEVLELRDIEIPAVGDGEMLVRVRAASVNPLDWHFMKGRAVSGPDDGGAVAAQGQRQQAGC